MKHETLEPVELQLGNYFDTSGAKLMMGLKIPSYRLPKELVRTERYAGLEPHSFIFIKYGDLPVIAETQLMWEDYGNLCFPQRTRYYSTSANYVVPGSHFSATGEDIFSSWGYQEYLNHKDSIDQLKCLKVDFERRVVV